MDQAYYRRILLTNYTSSSFKLQHKISQISRSGGKKGVRVSLFFCVPRVWLCEGSGIQLAHKVVCKSTNYKNLFCFCSMCSCIYTSYMPSSSTTFCTITTYMLEGKAYLPLGQGTSGKGSHIILVIMMPWRGRCSLPDSRNIVIQKIMGSHFKDHCRLFLLLEGTESILPPEFIFVSVFLPLHS